MHSYGEYHKLFTNIFAASHFSVSFVLVYVCKNNVVGKTVCKLKLFRQFRTVTLLQLRFSFAPKFFFMIICRRQICYNVEVESPEDIFLSSIRYKC
jgi:hypothetical protein